MGPGGFSGGKGEQGYIGKTGVPGLPGPMGRRGRPGPPGTKIHFVGESKKLVHVYDNLDMIKSISLLLALFCVFFPAFLVFFSGSISK